LTVPFSVAEVPAMSVAAVVVAVGGPGVVNETTPPNEVPWLLDAIAQT